MWLTLFFFFFSYKIFFILLAVLNIIIIFENKITSQKIKTLFCNILFSFITSFSLIYLYYSLIFSFIFASNSNKGFYSISNFITMESGFFAVFFFVLILLFFILYNFLTKKNVLFIILKKIFIVYTLLILIISFYVIYETKISPYKNTAQSFQINTSHLNINGLTSVENCKGHILDKWFYSSINFFYLDPPFKEIRRTYKKNSYLEINNICFEYFGECGKITEQNSLRARNCYLKKALKDYNFSICEKLSSDYRTKCYNSIYTKIAEEKNDYSICNKAISTSGKDWCFALLAEKNSNYLICDKIFTEEYKNNCYENNAYKTNNEKICEKITDEFKSTDCKGKILCLKIFNPDICWSASGNYFGDCLATTNDKAQEIIISKCFSENLLIYSNYITKENCDKYTVGSEKDNCYLMVSLKNKDIKLCEEIESEYYNKQCVDLMKLKKLK